MLQQVKPLGEMTRELVRVARARQEPDIVLTQARVLCVYTGQIFEDQEIWIVGGRIAKVCPAGSFLEPLRKITRSDIYVFNCHGGLLAPGLVDPHIHVESSRVSVSSYAEAALLNGTTTIIADNHEMANVCDVKGIEWMIEDGKRAPLNVFWTVPSTVPATSPELETSGGDLGAAKIGILMDKHPGVIVGLGEKMDYPQVIGGDARSHSIIAGALERGLPVSGHIYGLENVAPYAAAGVTDTHEAIDKDIAREVLRTGMWLFLRGGPPGTAWDSLPEAVKAITEMGCAVNRVCLCTDDRNPAELLEHGLDYVVREAIEQGVDPVTAWQMASLNPATRYGLGSEIGGLGPGRRADIVLLSDDWKPEDVWLGGVLMVRDRKPTKALEQALQGSYQYPEEAFHTVKLPTRRQLFPEPPERDSKVNIIGIEPPGILTRHLAAAIKADTSIEEFLKEEGLVVGIVLERHGKKGRFAYGFFKGLGIKEAAVASTVAHDAHNLIVAGDNEEDMAKAVEVLKENQGGICVVSRGEIRALVPLPIAGLMSPERVETVASRSKELMRAWREVGCLIGDMEFTLLSLSVVPELRLTDRGLVKVPEMELVPLFEPLEDSPVD